MKLERGWILLPDRLTLIDETNRAQHVFLGEDDRCLHFGEYFAYKGYQGGGTNQLIFNFKMKPSVAAANAARGVWKERAIAEVAAGLRKVATQESAEQLTWVPVPPSKIVGHAEYDDRLLRTLKMAFKGYNVDVRSLLRQTESAEGDHAGNRLSQDELKQMLEVDQAALAARPLGSGIVLFDDVLTTGKHFKCCQARLRDVVPGAVQIVGVFVARRVLPSNADELEDLT